jgi:hypothetical protein
MMKSTDKPDNNNTIEEVVESYINGNHEWVREAISAESSFTLIDVMEYYIEIDEPSTEDLVRMVRRLLNPRP